MPISYYIGLTALQLVAAVMMVYGSVKTRSKDMSKATIGFAYILFAFYLIFHGILAALLVIVEILLPKS